MHLITWRNSAHFLTICRSFAVYMHILIARHSLSLHSSQAPDFFRCEALCSLESLDVRCVVYTTESMRLWRQLLYRQQRWMHNLFACAVWQTYYHCIMSAHFFSPSVAFSWNSILNWTQNLSLGAHSVQNPAKTVLWIARMEPCIAWGNGAVSQVEVEHALSMRTNKSRARQARVISNHLKKNHSSMWPHSRKILDLKRPLQVMVIWCSERSSCFKNTLNDNCVKEWGTWTTITQNLIF